MPINLITGAEKRREEADSILYRSIHQYDKCSYDARNYGSVILIDGREKAHLLCCCHCNAHFLNIKIPGKERGWCMQCNAPVCPNPACDTCVPFMQMIENIERNLPPGHKPIKISVQGQVPQRAKGDIVIVGG